MMRMMRITVMMTSETYDEDYKGGSEGSPRVGPVGGFKNPWQKGFGENTLRRLIEGP